MAKAKSNATCKKGVASKSRKTKHGAAVRTTNAVTKAGMAKGTSRSLVTKKTVVVRTRKPRPVSPPHVSMSMNKIFCVGDLLPRNFGRLVQLESC